MAAIFGACTLREHAGTWMHSYCQNPSPKNSTRTCLSCGLFHVPTASSQTLAFTTVPSTRHSQEQVRKVLLSCSLQYLVCTSYSIASPLSLSPSPYHHHTLLHYHVSACKMNAYSISKVRSPQLATPLTMWWQWRCPPVRSSSTGSNVELLCSVLSITD